MHENLVTLDLAIQSLDPSPGELLVLFNHQLGALSVLVDVDDWAACLERACASLREARAERS